MQERIINCLFVKYSLHQTKMKNSLLFDSFVFLSILISLFLFLYIDSKHSKSKPKVHKNMVSTNSVAKKNLDKIKNKESVWVYQAQDSLSNMD